MKQLGVCPIASTSILRRALDELRERHVLDTLDREALEWDAALLNGLIPDHFFPDCTLDVPLMGGESGGITLSFDCYERCYLEDQSAGAYFRGLGLPARTSPENRDEVLLLRVKDGRFSPEISCSGKRTGGKLSDPETAAAFLAEFPFFQPLSGLPLRVSEERDGDLARVTVGSGPVFAQNRFVNQPYKDVLLDLLAKAGVPEERRAIPERASFNFGILFPDRERGIGKWIVYVDVAGFVFTLRGSEITDCRVSVRISDKCVAYQGMLSRRIQAYQWHITDVCDQRCRHCYLFAEDAARSCVSTPWDQLMLTLGQMEEDAGSRGAIPSPVLTGGDPLLHPEFWRLAEEIHRRGLSWSILGNPFHLDEAVCERLYQLGCLSYQLSLDGLPAYHDAMRKPGSYDATIRAIGLLNRAGIMSQLMATVSRQNREDVLACMDIAAEQGAGSFCFARYCATSPEKAAEAYMSPEEYRDFLLRYYEKVKQFKARHCKTGFPLKEHLFTLLRYELGEFRPTQEAGHPNGACGGCHLGQSLSILPNGDLMACRRMDSVVGNVKTDTIHDALRGERCERYREIRNIRKCRDCELLQWCRGCRAVGFNATGDLQGEDPCCWNNIF